MTQQGPNIIEIYEGAVQEMLPALAAVRPDQLTAQTACTEWNVQQLIIHNIKVADFVHGILQGNNTTDAGEVGGPLPAEGARDAFAAGTTQVLDFLKAANDLNQVIETPFGSMPISSFLMFPTMDIVLHKWDLAKGTGEGAAIDAGLAEACFGLLQGGAAAGGREMGIFGAEVTVPMSASIQDKLLALSGRAP